MAFIWSPALSHSLSALSLEHVAHAWCRALGSRGRHCDFSLLWTRRASGEAGGGRGIQSFSYRGRARWLRQEIGKEGGGIGRRNCTEFSFEAENSLLGQVHHFQVM